MVARTAMAACGVAAHSLTAFAGQRPVVERLVEELGAGRGLSCVVCAVVGAVGQELADHLHRPIDRDGVPAGTHAGRAPTCPSALPIEAT